MKPTSSIQGKRMTNQPYVDNDSIEKNEWVVVLCIKEQRIVSRHFKNTPTELGALVRFITERCVKPKICLNPVNPTARTLIEYIGVIPGVEVSLMSNVGLSLHSGWLPKEMTALFFQSNTRRAYLLACCSEQMI
jgi:hypothetical protein